MSQDRAAVWRVEVATTSVVAVLMAVLCAAGATLAYDSGGAILGLTALWYSVLTGVYLLLAASLYLVSTTWIGGGVR